MENNRVYMQHAIDAIMLDQKHKRIPVSEQQIAEKVGVPVETFRAYLKGDLPLPANFVIDLASKYGLSFGRVEHVVELKIRDSEDPEIGETGGQ